MVILNMGIPRSGTTWVYNVLRSIYSAQGEGCSVLNPLHPVEVENALLSVNENNNTIIHFHDVTESVINFTTQHRCAAFFNFRDPRDVVVSQMRLHDADFEVAVQMTMRAFESFHSATRIPGMMMIPYNHINAHADALIFQIGIRLGRFLRPSEISGIAKETSMARHRKMMHEAASKESDASDKIKASFSGVRNVKYNSETLITDRHIQSGKSGRWKKELDNNQRQVVNRVFNPIIEQFGFEQL